MSFFSPVAVIFLRMLEAAFLKADNFMKKILRVFERE